ncbi:hypothetical protein [Streptomyces sp. NPDC056672]|uniref:hypothetical protein n=1 Tax=Streptomyces sp. NPDC056672 TaxID=3345906 RepID=UPI0036A66FBC
MSGTTRFVLLVEENCWTSYEKFCIHWAKAAERAARKEMQPDLARVEVSRSSFNRWMGRKSGGIKGTPRREAYLILRHMFHMSVERLFESVDAQTRAPVSADINLVAPTAQQVGFEDPLEVVAQARALTGSNADPAFLAMARASVESIVDRYELLGPQQLAGEGRLLRNMLHTVLGGQQPPRVRQELFGMAARTSGLLGYMAVNAGATYRVVDAYCIEAEILARAIGDTHLMMWAAGTRSLGPYYQGRYAEADKAALAGIVLAPRSGQAIRLLINGRARALARQGDRRATERAIGQALKLSERQGTPSDGLTSCISFAPYSLPRTLANAITAHLSLGNTNTVQAYASQIDDLVEHSDSHWSRALVGLDMATALLQSASPEVEQAMALGRNALRTASITPITSVWQRANELYELASRWHDEPDVGDYAEELRVWRARPQAELIAVESSASEHRGEP